MTRRPAELADRIAGLSPAKRELLERRLSEREARARESEAILPRPDHREAPLSFAQQRLCFLDRLEPGSAAYNVPRAFRIRGPLDAGALERVFEELLRRHECLRSRFVERESGIVAEIDPPSPFRLRVESVPGGSEEAREETAREILETESRRPFDLERGPVLRVRLLELGPDHHVLLMTNHHVVSDAWSAGVLFAELTELYAAFSSDRPSPLPDLSVQYGDFAAWQRQWLRGEELERQLSYWRGQLAGAPSALDLPTDRPRPAVQSSEGALEVVRFDAETSAGLRALSRREGVTLFMTLLAAYQALLYRYTGQADVVVGTPIANRNRPEIEGLIGFFINTLVLRTDLSGNPTFRELLARVRDVALGAYAHQDLPFEKLVAELAVGRDLSRGPLFQTMLALQNAPPAQIRWPGLTVEPLEVGRTTSKFDLSLFFEDAPGGLVCTIEYATDLFDAGTIRRLGSHLGVLFAAVVADPDVRVDAAPILSETERRKLVVEWNATKSDFPSDRCLHELFEAQADRTPDAVAVREGAAAVRYRDLDAQANRLARELRSRGVEPGSVVGVCLERSAQTVAALLSAWKAGAAYVPIDPAYPAERIRFMIRDSGARLVVTTSRFAPSVQGSGADAVVLDEISSELAGRDPSRLGVSVSPGDLAYVIYTSGSTGAPRGVEAVHRASMNRFAWMWRAYPFAAGEVCCQKTTLSFVDSVWEIFGPLLHGVPSVVLSADEARDPRLLVERLSRERVTRIVLVPSLLSALLESEVPLAEKLPALRWWISSGEALPLDLYRRFRRAMPEAVLINLYGSSEVTADVTSWDSREGDPEGSVPIGRPIANARVYVLDGRRHVAPIGVAGEIHVGGEVLARGYRGRPETTAERFVPDPFAEPPGARMFATGDLGRFRADGNLEYLGRKDDQVKIRGFRIEPGEVEAAIATHPDVRQVAVGVPREEGREPRLVAWIVAREGAGASSEQLRLHAARRLPEFMVPSAFVFLESLPMTASGKIDRRRLPLPGAARPELARPFRPPESPIEAAVAGVWAEVLRLDRVGIDDDFFALGGHSLLLVQVSSRLRATAGIDLPLRAFFEHPTVRELARAAELARPDPSSEIPRAPEGAGRPLSFAEQRIWLIDQLDPGNTGYLIRRAYRLEGRLRPSLLRRAVEAVVARHEVLRTRFTAPGAMPAPEVVRDSDAPVPWEEVDLSELPEEEGEREISRRVRSEAEVPIDLATAPLLRFALLRTGEEEHVLLLTVHHIAADAWSISILMREIAAAYGAYLEGRPPALPRLSIQYGDFAAWQKERLSGERLEGSLAYWRRELAGAPEVLDLATDRPRPARRTASGGRRRLALSRERTEALKALGRRSDATLYMTLAAAYAAFLAQFTTQEDVVIGSPIAGRDRLETEPLIGLFVNTVLLRARLAGDPSFAELLARVREAAIGAFAHQDLPFEMLVDEIRPARSLAHNPLFQVWFVLQNAPASEWELRGIATTEIDAEPVTVRHDLQLTAWETGTGLRASLDFSSDIFDPPTMDRLTEELGIVLESVAADPRQRLSDLGRALSERRDRRRDEARRRLDEAAARGLKSARRRVVRG